LAVAAPPAALPPQNIEAEESVLGAMLVAEGVIAQVVVDVRLRPEDFYRESHRLIFRAVLELDRKNEAVDSLTVSAELEERGDLDAVGGKAYVHQLAAAVPAAGNAPHYARIVKEHATLRGLLDAARDIQSRVTDRRGEPQQLVEDAERRLFEVAHADSARDFRSIHDILHEEIDKLERLSREGQSVTGTPSGFRDLDNVTGGFQASNLVVLAARPSMGKSALVANIAENVAVKHGRPVALFSLEMSETELAQRFVASQARMSGDKLRKGQVAKGDWPKVIKACEKLEQAPLWVDDSSDIDILELRAKARRLHSREASRGGLGLVVVDYLQLMRPDRASESRVEQVGQISRGLKILARELGVPVLAVSQLSRAPEQRPDKRPILADLRESGQIEQDADLVMFIYRDEYYNPDTENPGVAEINIAKHRNGPVSRIELTFLERYPKFASKAREERPVLQAAGEGPPLGDGFDADSSAGGFNGDGASRSDDDVDSSEGPSF
jgi:replicative DNA helicase